MQVNEYIPVSFELEDTTGALVNADALPTAVLYRNTVSVVGASITVTNLTTGKYRARALLSPAHNWIAGDEWELRVDCVIAGKAKSTSWTGHIRDSVASAAATGVLATPANKLATDASGQVLLQPSATTTQLTAISNYVDTVEASLTSITSSITTLQNTANALGVSNSDITAAIATLYGLANTIVEQTDTLEGSAASLIAAVGNVETIVDGIEAAPSADTVADAVASKILITPANKLATDDEGRVAVDGGFTDDDRAALLAAKNKILSIGTAKIIFRGPVISSEEAEVTRGADYYRVDGRALSWDITGTGLELLDVSQIDFILNNDQTLVKAAQFEVIEGGVRIWVELSAEETAGFTWDAVNFHIWATLNNTNKSHLGSGRMIVKDGGEDGE